MDAATDVHGRFREWAKAQGGGSAAARLLGCSKGFVSTLMTEKKEHRQRPGWPLAKVIEKLSGIPATEWMESDPGRPSRCDRRLGPQGRPKRSRYVIVLDDGRSLFGEFTEVDGVTDSGQRVLVGRLQPPPGNARSESEAAA
jgi:hypothetical protein